MPNAARQRSAHSSALAQDTVTWWKSRRPLRGAGAVSNRKSARYVLLQVNKKFCELKGGNIGIVEKAQETRFGMSPKYSRYIGIAS